jgi:hypothetical protein
MIPKSFIDELTKTAALPGFLSALGGFFAKNVPAMATSLRGSAMAAGMADVAKMRVAGGVVGAAGGAFAGSRTGDESTKGRNTLLGAIAGGVGGAMGGKALAAKVPTLGSQTVKDLSGLGQYMQKGKATGKGVVEYMARNWTPKYTKDVLPPAGHQIGMFGTSTPAVRTMGGIGKETPAIAMQTHKPGLITGAFGQAAKQISTAKTKGIGAMLSQDIQEAKVFNKTIEGQSYQFRRSGLGRVVNPAMTSGVGFGALEAATATDEQGRPASMSKRLLKGGTTALAWGAAPKIMTGKMLAYDVPKTLIGMKKQKELPRQ